MNLCISSCTKQLIQPCLNYFQIGDFGMARDLMDETYYTPKTKGGKIPIKWTAPEVTSLSLGISSLYVIMMLHQKQDFHISSIVTTTLIRLFIIRSTRLTVMCGAMVWCCLRSGQLGRSHSHNT